MNPALPIQPRNDTKDAIPAQAGIHNKNLSFNPNYTKNRNFSAHGFSQILTDYSPFPKGGDGDFVGAPACCALSLFPF